MMMMMMKLLIVEEEDDNKMMTTVMMKMITIYIPQQSGTKPNLVAKILATNFGVFL